MQKRFHQEDVKIEIRTRAIRNRSKRGRRAKPEIDPWAETTPRNEEYDDAKESDRLKAQYFSTHPSSWVN